MAHDVVVSRSILSIQAERIMNGREKGIGWRGKSPRRDVTIGTRIDEVC